MAQVRLAPSPKKIGFTGAAGLLAILLLLLILPGVLAYVNLAKPETRSLVIELEQQLFGRELTMQDVSYIPLMKTEINRILAVFQADPQPAAAQAVQKQAADLSEQASRGQGALWIGSIALISSFFLIVSLHITGRPLGLLVNERNLISLSRFQTLLWTIMLLSAYYSAASLRIYGLQDIGNALNIAMDWHLWALMGISFTSLVATPLIHTTKQAKTISPDEADKLQPADVEGSDGILYANANFSDASWTDMFKGEEVKNVNIVDMAKLQMFFFTIIAAASYAALLLQLFNSRAPGGLTEFPAVSEGLLALLGISHAGYLTSKTIDRTKSTP